MTAIFISHNSNDAREAVALKRWLADNGWDDVFLDIDLKMVFVRGSAGRTPCRTRPTAAKRCCVWSRPPGWPRPSASSSTAMRKRSASIFFLPSSSPAIHRSCHPTDNGVRCSATVPRRLSASTSANSPLNAHSWRMAWSVWRTGCRRPASAPSFSPGHRRTTPTAPRTAA